MRQTLLWFFVLVLTISTGCENSKDSPLSVNEKPQLQNKTQNTNFSNDSNSLPTPSLVKPSPHSVANVLQDPQDISDFLEGMINHPNDLIVERDYLGRLIEIKGVVERVSYGDNGLIYVATDPQIKVNWPGMLGEMSTIFHYGFDTSEKDHLADINQGDIITLRGKFTGFYKTKGEFNYRAVFAESELR